MDAAVSRRPPTLLDGALPRWRFAERHAAAVAADGAVVFAAVRAVTPAEAPLLRVLFAVRGLPAGGGAPIWSQLLRTGFTELCERPGRELVAAAIGRPWRPTEGLRRVAVGDFGAFDEPGWAKMALGFCWDGAVLSTETRIEPTDEAAARAFARYWRVVAPASGLTRRSWLAAVKRRAERRG
jgi:hypothetical protein